MSRLAWMIVLIITACGGGGDRLAEQPETELLYPGSSELSEGSRDRVDDVLGTTNAAWWLILGTDASMAEVQAFYQAELTERDWTPSGGVPSTSEIDAIAWTRNSYTFRLGFKETEEWYQRLEGSDEYTTLFEIRLIESEP